MIKDKDYKLEYIELLRNDYGYNVNGWNTNDPFVSIIWGNTIYSDTRENIINALVVEDDWKREFLESKSNLELLKFYKEAFGDEILDDDMDLNTVETLDRWYNDQVEEDLIPLDLLEEDEELIEDDNNIIDLEKQKEAVKILEKNPKAYAVIYGYTTPDNRIKYLNPMLKKYSQEEVEEYENSFRNGKAASDTIIHVVYRSQLGKYKKDADTRLELIKKIKKLSDFLPNVYSFDLKDYNLNDLLFGYFEEWVGGISREDIIKQHKNGFNYPFDKLDEELESKGISYTDYLNSLSDDKLIEFAMKEDQQGSYALYPNTIEGLESFYEEMCDYIYDYHIDDFSGEQKEELMEILGVSDNLTEDSKQKEICDSFGDRYKKY